MIKIKGDLRMKHSKLKLYVCLLLSFVLSLPIFLIAGCGNDSKKTEFHDAVVESQTKLDIVADTIYRAWYDLVYKDKYSSSVDLALATARLACAEELTFIEENDEKIKSLYKEVRDSDLKDEIKAVMSAYGDYYEFVVNVSGSFKPYSANKETYKKVLAAALKDLEMEL